MGAGTLEAHSAYAGAGEPEWWERFFESPDSVRWSYVPAEPETEREVAGVRRLLRLKPSDRILDVCCGMGRHAVALGALGYGVVGIDRSAMMVSMATETASSMGAGCWFVRADAGRLPFGQRFTKVLNLFNSFGYCETDEGNLRILAETARCLEPGGELLLETRNKARQLLALPYGRYERLTGGHRVRLRCYYDATRRRLNSEWTDADDEDVLHHFASIRLYDLDELKSMLSAAGLRIAGIYGDYDGTPFDQRHRQLILLCRRADVRSS
jgi:ubiquinone/menaquinone biosynthesis C-methylase UbiE